MPGALIKSGGWEAGRITGESETPQEHVATPEWLDINSAPLPIARSAATGYEGNWRES